MHRSLLPFILASLGHVIVLLATSSARPLFEWQINDISTNFPAAYEIHVSPHLLTTSIGASLNDISYRGKVYVSKDGEVCRSEDLKFDARRSESNESLELALLNIDEKLFAWSAIEIYLCGIYIWLSTIWNRRPIWEAFISTVLAGFIFILLTQAVRPYLYKVGPPFEYFGNLACYRGMVTFNVVLSKVHYETPVLLLVGILLELGAIGLILRQIMKAIIQRKESSKSAVG
jgi:hypothetical protein